MLFHRHCLGPRPATPRCGNGSFVFAGAQNGPKAGTPSLFAPGLCSMKVGDVETIAVNSGKAGLAQCELTSVGERFFDTADLANMPVPYARHRRWTVALGMAAEAAREVRREVFQRITARNAMRGSLHFPFPAFARFATGPC